MKSLEITVPELPYSVEEAMNQLRVNIKFCGKHTKKILITSSIPNEGKSIISACLWKMLAEAGFPTVLVDADLRGSVAKGRWRMQGTGELKGLDYYLSGLSEYQDVVYATNVENGFIVPITNVLENPSPLLEAPRLSELFDRLSEDYRYVIIDTPPLDMVSDGTLIASLCDGAILVVGSGMTSKRLVKQSMQQLERARCSLLGVVLNHVDAKPHKYSKNYGYGYGYGNGYGYGYGEYYGKEDDDKKKKSKKKRASQEKE